MKHPFQVGFSFGLTSSVITTLGLLVGLNSATHSKLVVIGGLITIAFADALSDSLGIHLSEESENKHTTKQIWEATFSTFFSKIIFTLSFVIPLLIFTLPVALIINIIWGLSLLSFFSYYLSQKQRKTRPWKVITEHLVIAIAVIILTHFVGQLVARFFG